jgi:hypothetical protein
MAARHSLAARRLNAPRAPPGPRQRGGALRGKAVSRVTFSEVTRRAVESALRAPREVGRRRIRQQQMAEARTPPPACGERQAC